MKKLKLFFACLLMAVLSIGQVWATSPATLSFTAKCNGSGTDSDGNTWTITSDGTESQFDNTSGIHYGTNSASVTYVQLSTSGVTGTITQVVVNARDARATATVSVTVGETALTCSGSATATNTSADYTFTGNASGNIVVRVDRGSSNTKAIYVKSVVVTYTTGSVVNVTSVELDESSITLGIDGEEQKTLTATVSPDNATNKNVTWESDDESVATVANGVVTAVGAGDATITCKSVADETKYAECAVHVNASPYTKSTLIFTAACGGSGTADDGAEWTVTSDGTESQFDNTSGIHYGTNSAEVTYLQLATSDISGTISKVVVNARDAQAKATISVTVGGTAFSCASATATNTSADYVFTGTGSGEIVVRVDRGSSMAKAIYVKSVKVSYIPSASVKKPSFSVEGGSYLGAQEVEITCATAGANIFYTLDGNDPTSGSTPYNGAISITETKTLKAIAIKDEVSSPIASATYTIINTEHAGTELDPYSVADAKIVIDGIGTKEDAYVSGKISQVDEYLSSYKSITYWISADGTTSGQQLKVYSGKGIDGADFSSIDDVVAKATVVVKGTLKKYNEVYEFDYNNELVSYVEPVEPVVTLKQSGTTVTVLNLEATGVADQAIDIVCDNFGGEITSVSAKLYEESACETEITSGAWVTDITVNGAKDQVTFNVADNAGEARQVWLKVVASDGSNDAFAVLNIKQAKYTVDYAELPFAFDGGRADVEDKDGMTQEGLDSDYGSSPKLKFNSTDDVVIIKINADPGTLTYDIKGNSFSDGTFKVQQSADGVDYDDVASYTELGTESESYTLAQTTRYVKFIYTEKVNGNVALGNITISAYVAPVVTPTVAADPDEVEVDAEAHAGQSLGLTYENWGTVNVDEVEATLWNDEACTEPFDGGWISNVAVAAGNVSVSFDIAANTGDARAAYMKIYALGDDGDTDAQTIVSISQAKYSAPTGTFELFSGDLAEGEYVICSGTNAMKNVVTSSPRIDVATVTISENKIQDPDASLIWKIEALTGDDAGKWTIYNESESVYAAFNPTDGRGVLLDAVTDYAKWTTSGSYDFINVGKASKNYLRYNDGYGFASYATTTGEELTLYKKSDGKPAAPTFTPAAGSYLGAQSVTISAAAGASIYYTTDGSTTPTTSSTLYTEPINVSTNTTIKAIAVKDDVSSNVATAAYTIINTEHAGTALDPYSVADAKAVIDGIGTKEDAYVSGKISQVDEYLSSYKSITYWISADGTTSGQQLKVYSGKDIDGADFSSIDDVVAKATVVVKGTLKKYNDVYEFDYNNQLVSYAAPVEPTVTLKQSGSTVTSLNLDATGVANQAIDVECTNFADAISSVTAELYEESTCETKITSGAWVTDITVNGANNQVTFNVADNDGDARQVWMKVTASDGTNEAYAVLNIKQAKFTVDYAELPFAFDGGKADIATTNGMTQSGLGSDYTGSGVTTKLKFDNTGDNLIIHINEVPGTLTYDIKGNGFSGGTFKVQESKDGETYSDLATYDEDGTSVEHQLASTTRYIKFVYAEKSSGNIGLGNIHISEYVAPEPTPDYTRGGLTVGRYYTVCLPKNVTAATGATFWNLKNRNAAETEVYLEEAGLPEAGKPYIFQATDATLNVVYGDQSEDAPVANGALRGTFEDLNAAQLAAKAANVYILIQNQLAPAGGANSLKANRAYIDYDALTVGTPKSAPGKRVIAMPMQKDQAQGFENLDASEKPLKVMIDGTLYILRGEKVYDATGRLVK